jgi:hypothetical protein
VDETDTRVRNFFSQELANLKKLKESRQIMVKPLARVLLIAFFLLFATYLIFGGERVRPEQNVVPFTRKIELVASKNYLEFV